MIVDVKFSITTDSSGDYTATSTEAHFGKLVALDYNLSGLDAGADTTLSFTGGAGVSRSILVLTNSQGNATSALVTDGLTAAGAASGTDLEVYILGPLVLTVAQGGNVTTGTFVAYIEK